MFPEFGPSKQDKLNDRQPLYKKPYKLYNF